MLGSSDEGKKGFGCEAKTYSSHQMLPSDVDFGRAGNRTQDLSHTGRYAKRTLYQLSHTPEEFVVVDGEGGSCVCEGRRQGAEP